MPVQHQDTQQSRSMNQLEELIRMRIEQNGPMSISEFMALALGHPKYGYYMSRDPFGRGGDFTTAPEISQMFGEMIGAWLADSWERIGAPDKFILLECGPGRGTLMADILRATRGVSGFHAALDLHLLEMSPVLREKQKEALTGYEPVWHDTLETVPDDAPLFVIGNEFLDALPVQHLISRQGQWMERKVGFDGDHFVFVATDAAPDLTRQVPQGLARPRDGEIYECSPISQSVMQQLCERIVQQKGVMLFIDYGYVEPACGDTLQAVKDHAYLDLLKDIGEADITAHVDFSALAEIAREHRLNGFITTQGDFLRRLGIDMRAQTLLQKASPVQQKDIMGALNRLTEKDRMGELFKVWAATSESIALAGGA